jgi:hypothetical protein
LCYSPTYISSNVTNYLTRASRSNTGTCPDGSSLEGRPIVVVGGGGGSSKTGISNQVIVGHVGKKQGRVGLVGTFTLNLDQLPSSIAIGSSSFDEKGSCLVAFNVESKLRLCKLLEGRRLVRTNFSNANIHSHTRTKTTTGTRCDLEPE